MRRRRCLNGSMTPALPMRMRSVVAAIAAMTISGAVPVIVSWLWCSDTQKRR